MRRLGDELCDTKTNPSAIKELQQKHRLFMRLNVSLMYCVFVYESAYFSLPASKNECLRVYISVSSSSSIEGDVTCYVGL